MAQMSPGNTPVTPNLASLIAAESALARSADNLTSGTVAASRVGDLSATYGRVLAASGDTSGATDLANINALNRCVLVPGSTYYVNGPIIRQSHSLIEAHGATIHLTVGGTNIIRNNAVSATRTVTDGVVTNGSPTFTSPTAAFVSGDVGSMVGVVA